MLGYIENWNSFQISKKINVLYQGKKNQCRQNFAQC